MDLFTPNVLETPSLFTPNIGESPLPVTVVSQVTKQDERRDDSPANEKLSKIENELRLSFRQPTQSPFFSKSDLPGEKSLSMENGYPSTADVVHDIESFDKTPTRENGERESEPMVGMVSLKKRLIIRSQSRTELEEDPPKVEFTTLPKPVDSKRTLLLLNEVTSSDPLIGSKRVKNEEPYVQHLAVGSDDSRKKQIRDSNREAARRCRERRRNYIEQLEGNLEQHKQQIKQLTEKVTRAERENTQLRAVMAEMNIFQARRGTNEPMAMTFPRVYLT